MLYKSDLVDRVAIKYHVMRPDALLWVNAILDEMKQMILEGGVCLGGFGKFDLYMQAQRPGHDVNTGERVVIAPRQRVRFHPARGIKYEVAKLPISSQEINNNEEQT